MKIFHLWFIAALASLASGVALAQEGSKPPEPDKIGNLLVYPLNHATFVLGAGDLVIYVDPVGGASRFQGIPRPGLILITDIHGDHLNADTVKAVSTAKTVIVAPEAVRRDLEKSGIDAKSIQVLENGKTAKVLGTEIEAVPMYNTSKERLKYHEKGRGNGYVLNLAGTRVYISGDTEDIPEMRMLKNIDAAFVCMNLPFTMTTEQAADAVLAMKPRVVYPYHYRGREQSGWQDPENFRSLVNAKSRAIDVRMRDWYAVK